MECPDCGAPAVVFDVPEEFRACVPDEAAVAAVCSVCLELVPAGGTDPDHEFERISSAFPTDEGAAVPMAITVGLLESLALNRKEIETLLCAVERAGGDPLLVLDRLDAQGAVQPPFDLGRRRHQIQQLLE